MAGATEISDSDIKRQLGDYIRKKLLKGEDTNLNDDESFLEKGIIDSTGVLELVNFIEETFNIRVEDDELIPDNLDSLNKMTSYVKRKI